MDLRKKEKRKSTTRMAIIFPRGGGGGEGGDLGGGRDLRSFTARKMDFGCRTGGQTRGQAIAMAWFGCQGGEEKSKST